MLNKKLTTGASNYIIETFYLIETLRQKPIYDIIQNLVFTFSNNTQKYTEYLDKR